jgi:hypothetical protein
VFDSTRYVAVPGSLATSLGDEMIVLALGSGVYYGLNPVAALVWEQLSTPRTLDELVAAVEAEFDTEGEDTRGDVGELLSTLSGHGLVAEIGVPAAAV